MPWISGVGQETNIIPSLFWTIYNAASYQTQPTGVHLLYNGLFRLAAILQGLVRQRNFTSPDTWEPLSLLEILELKLGSAGQVQHTLCQCAMALGEGAHGGERCTRRQHKIRWSLFLAKDGCLGLATSSQFCFFFKPWTKQDGTECTLVVAYV